MIIPEIEDCEEADDKSSDATYQEHELIFPFRDERDCNQPEGDSYKAYGENETDGFTCGDMRGGKNLLPVVDVDDKCCG